MKRKDKIRILEKKIEELKDVLCQINKIVFHKNIKHHSDEYFKILELCVDTVRETDLRMVETWENDK
jgi:hypothetical protein